MSTALDPGALLQKLHRLRSTLARVKAELEIAQLDRLPPSASAFDAMRIAFAQLEAIESMLVEQPAPIEGGTGSDNVGRVVIVDDDQRLAQLTARQLRRYGFATLVRDDPVEAALELQPGDALVVDLGLLEDLDHESRARVRAVTPIVLTGSLSPAAQDVATGVDAAAYLVKPVEAAVLAQMLRSTRVTTP